MAKRTNYIMIDRNMESWRWFHNSKVVHVFLWLLIRANIKDHDFEHTRIPRGSLATSYQHIADACGMSVGSVRTVIANLKETGEIEQVIKDHYQIIKILKYDDYQGCQKSVGHSATCSATSLTTSLAGISQQSNNGNKGNNEKERKEESASQIFPCGVGRKPEWMADGLWETVKYRTVDNIPGIDRGFYDLYIEYAEEMHRQGRDVR